MIISCHEIYRMSECQIQSPKFSSNQSMEGILFWVYAWFCFYVHGAWLWVIFCGSNSAILFFFPFRCSGFGVKTKRTFQEKIYLAFRIKYENVFCMWRVFLHEWNDAMMLFLLFAKAVFPNLLEFGDHLLLKLNKSSLILKNNAYFNLKFIFFTWA